MKPGANRTDQVNIYKLMQQGFDSAQISRKLRIYEKCVKNFMKAFKDDKKVPQTSAFMSIKAGMPRLPGKGKLEGMHQLLSESKAENKALLSRIEALEALVNKGDADDGLG